MPKTFPITGKPLRSDKDSGVIYFELDSDKLDDDELKKIRDLAKTDRPLALTVYVSDDEANCDPTAQDNLRRGRIEAVVKALKSTSWKGNIQDPEKVTAQPQIDFRKTRAVRIVVDNRKKRTRDKAAHQPCPEEFDKARVLALSNINVALEKLCKPQPSDSDLACVHRLFGDNVDINELTTRLKSIQIQVQLLKKWSPQPNQPEDPPVDDGPWYRLMTYGHSPLASNSGYGDKAIVTFGPQSIKRDIKKTAFTFVHECTHGSRLIKGIDWAYRKDRMFEWLPPEKALTNPDSYALLVNALTKGDPTTTFPEDIYAEAIFGDDLIIVKMALAYVERYMVDVGQHLYKIHRSVWKHVHKGTKIRPTYLRRLTRARKCLDYSPSSSVTIEDCVMLAGVYDRHLPLLKRLRDKRINVCLSNGLDTRFEDPDMLSLGTEFLTRKAPGGAPSASSRQVNIILDALIAAEDSIPADDKRNFRKVIVAFATIGKLTPQP